MDQQPNPNPFAHRGDPAQWLSWQSFWRKYPDLFPSENSARHFIDSRKPKLRDLGLLMETTRGFFVRRDLDQFLLHLLADTSKPDPALSSFSDEQLRAELERRAA